VQIRDQVESHANRSGWIVVGVTIIAWAFLLFGYNDAYPWLAYIEVVTTLVGMGIVVVSLWHVDDAIPRGLGLVGLVVSCFAFLTWCWVQVRVAPAYGTDEAAFDQYAAQLFVHGVNPYTHSMAPAFNIFHVSPNGHTFRINGTSVNTLSYPALSFLVYVPFLWLGLGNQLAITLNVVVWLLGVVVSYFLLPRAVKPLAIVVGSLAIYTGFAVGGVTDAIYTPLLIAALYQWDRFADRGRLSSWVSPALMGLAMSVKQTPWFIIPFLLLGLALEEITRKHGWRVGVSIALSYLWRLSAVFFLVNLYSLLQNPVAWLRGVVTPFFDHLVPAGEGWIAISDFLGRGGGNLLLYTIFFATVGLLCFVVFTLTYPRSRGLLVFFPSVMLFFATRSYSNYLVMLILPALVAFCSVRPSPPDAPRVRVQLLSTRPRALAFLGALALIPLAAIAVSVYPQPISLHIDSVQTTGQLATVIDVTMTVTNHLDTPVTPVFASQSGGAITAPWNIVAGTRRIPPHKRVVLSLQAPNFFAQPSLSGGFQMVALTSSPQAMSVSPPYVPTRFHINLTPEAIDRPVGIGQQITVKAEVLSPTDAPINLAGIPVYLGQISYAQSGIIYTQAVINNSQPGATPVEASTDSHGVATFTISDLTASLNPVYFEANLVNGASSYPYGYSNILTIRFN